MIGATLIFFWLIVAVTAPFLPLIDPNKPIAPFAGRRRVQDGSLFLSRAPISKGRDMLLARSVGLPAGAGLGRDGDVGRLCRRRILRSGRRLSRRLVGPGDLLVWQHVLLSFPVMVLFILILNYLGASGFNIVIAVTFASAPAIMRIVRGLTLDTKTPRLHFRRADARRASAAHHDLSSCCPMRADRSSSMPVCGSAIRRSPSPR